MSASNYLDVKTKPMIAVIGVTAKGASTLVATPDGLKAPHEIQAAVLATLLNGSNISRPVWADGAEIIALVAVLILLAILSSNLIFSIPALITTVLGAGILTRHLFLSDGLLLDPSFIIFGACTLWAISNFMNFLIQFRMRQEIKKQFEHYLDPRMVRKLQKDPTLLKLGGERRDMTFLFCDIRGFTPISEGYKDNPKGLVELINRFLTNQTDIILRHGGTVDKYMGDCIMAFWNAPLDEEKHAEKAVQAALEMRRGLQELNNVLQHERGIEINTGIGVNTGPCIVGNMGSSSRFDYSVIGDAVNLASRLEGQCKDYNTDLIISEATMKQAVLNEYDKLGEVTVKGKSEPVSIFTIQK
jgi:adenylate cyclase